MDLSKHTESNCNNCFICGEKATDICNLCDSGVAYCGERHMKIHREEVYGKFILSALHLFKSLILLLTLE